MIISGKEILKTFKPCMYDYDNEKEFTDAFNSLIRKVHGTSGTSGNEVNEEEEKRTSSKKKVNRENWLNFIFKVKEIWAECYMKNVVTLGMRSAQLSESFNRNLKSFLK